jgi:hypothetical protein
LDNFTISILPKVITKLAELDYTISDDKEFDVLAPIGENIDSRLSCNERFSLICRKEHPILTDLTLENFAMNIK